METSIMSFFLNILYSSVLVPLSFILGCWLCFLFFISLFNLKLGVDEFYISALLKIFQSSRERIEIYNREESRKAKSTVSSVVLEKVDNKTNDNLAENQDTSISTTVQHNNETLHLTKTSGSDSSGVDKLSEESDDVVERQEETGEKSEQTDQSAEESSDVQQEGKQQYMQVEFDGSQSDDDSDDFYEVLDDDSNISRSNSWSDGSSKAERARRTLNTVKEKASSLKKQAKEKAAQVRQRATVMKEKAKVKATEVKEKAKEKVKETLPKPLPEGALKSQFSDSDLVIERSSFLTWEGKTRSTLVEDMQEECQEKFELAHVMEFCKYGMEAIIEDEFTKRFDVSELDSWNLLTRTNRNYQYISLRLSALWVIGFIFRYMILFPVRVCIFFFGLLNLIMWSAAVGLLPDCSLRHYLNRVVSLTCYRVWGRCFNTVVNFHNLENKPKPGGICVANHTSVLDVLVLSVDNCYSLVGQQHDGIIGTIESAMSRASSHIWFDRFESRDRTLVSRKLQEHTQDLSKNPVLLFPEGTCVNNTSVVQFKKGCFEVDAQIYPVAIRYDTRFSDVYWNFNQPTMGHHLYHNMTSWAIVADVWYLPAMKRVDGESVVQFASRVKRAIARQGGLIDCEWDGMLKLHPVKSEWKGRTQEQFSRRIKSE